MAEVIIGARRYTASCPLGFTRADLEEQFGAKVGEKHPLWEQLRGQTGAICEGRSYNHDAREYTPNECANNPHGFISYVSDVAEWVKGQTVSDW